MPDKKNNELPRIDTEQFSTIDKIKFEEELAIDIARKYGIEKETAFELITMDTTSSLEGLRKDIEDSIDSIQKLSEKDKKELFDTIIGAKKLIENTSKIEIKVLKDNLENSNKVENFKNRTEEFLPPGLIKKAKNPQAPHEHILGFALGTADSILTTTEVLLQIGIGILKGVPDLYMIMTGKAEYKKFKDI